MSGIITIHLDWLRYTIPWDEQKTEIENLDRARPGIELFEFTGETIDIGQGYNRGLRMNAGFVLWNSERPGQGIGVQLAGLDLQALRHTEVSEIDMLRFISAQGGHASTIHSAINVHDSGGDVRQLIAAHDTGEVTARARQMGVYTSKTRVGEKWLDGDTFYIGSAKSAIQIRVYNKAAEQGIDGDWIRIEIVWRGRHARAAHEMMLRVGIEATTRGAILHQVSTRLPWWTSAMSGETVAPLPVTRRPSERYKWLHTVVIPALRRQIADEDRIGQGDTRKRFSEVVKTKKKRRRGLT